MKDVLELFQKNTGSWFYSTLGTPTQVQREAWPVIAEGRHVLVSAPTGTGKTLSAFLVFIDKMLEQAKTNTLTQELQLIYISPLKSLAGDIRENLKRPLDGILAEQREEGNPLSGIELQVGIRTGDTSQKDRSRMIKTPPHILITTPESLYLMLTSKSGQKILKTAKAIIIDELHAMIDTKRGAHLMLSVARLDRLCGRSLQRIGLSATIEPLPLAAQYLAPVSEPAAIIAPQMHKAIEICVTSPLSEQRTRMRDPVWQELAGNIFEQCGSKGSSIAFVEGRAYAEKLAYFINQLGGDGFARTHHGSLSKEQRFEVEQALRSGSLRLLCATSSMELGIDVGEIDRVFQVGCPRSISSTMQRLGRAGHNPNRISAMNMYPREAIEGLYCGLTAETARQGGIEPMNPPRLCFDILAQHLVSMACTEEYSLDSVIELLQRAYPFKDISTQDIKDILCMLAGDYEHEREIPVRPRLLYDRLTGVVRGDAYSRMLAVSAGGTIPDRGLYSCKTEDGVKLGELDEEFVFETRIGDRFLLGTFAWKIKTILRDTVIVTRTSTAGARLPFWHGDLRGRRLKTGRAFGSILRRLNEADAAGKLIDELEHLGLDENAALGAEELLKRQLRSTGVLPNDKNIILEHFLDENSNHQLMVHSVFGRQVNEPLSLLLKEAVSRHTETSVLCLSDDDGCLLALYDGTQLPEGLLLEVEKSSARVILSALLPATPLYNMNFRYNTARALLMGVRSNKRQPLWVQRMRSAELLASVVDSQQHPILRETRRECLEDYWDLDGVEWLLDGIGSGEINVLELYTELPSPMSLPLRRQTEASMMYDYSPTPKGIHQAVEEALREADLVTPGECELTLVSERARLPEDKDQLHSLLMIEGDVIAGELQVPVEWLEALAAQGRALYIEPGLWIAAEQQEDYTAAFINEDFSMKKRLVQRLLRYRGAKEAEEISQRYLWTLEETTKLMETLVTDEKVVCQEGIYFHRELYSRARKATIQNRRKLAVTQPPERYAALLASRLSVALPPAEQLREAILSFQGLALPAAAWESILLPARVTGYRPELLDLLLTEGELFWQMDVDGSIRFHPSENADWEGDLTETLECLSGNERVIYEALMKFGASFVQRLTPHVEGSPYEALFSLAEKGLVCADSFVPVRQWLDRQKLSESSPRQRINARAKVLSTGRWEIVRPKKPADRAALIHLNFDRSAILCRETVQQMTWTQALETLRIWEYTGQVRRGYFVEGLSGIQFIREMDYAAVTQRLSQMSEQLVWLNATDTAQPYGKCLKHLPDRAFQNIKGSAVALCGGIPVAVFERQGKLLRVFDTKNLAETLRVFVRYYTERRIFPSQSRILVKEYPSEAAQELLEAGFVREMQDFAFYRGYR